MFNIKYENQCRDDNVKKKRNKIGIINITF